MHTFVAIVLAMSAATADVCISTQAKDALSCPASAQAKAFDGSRPRATLGTVAPPPSPHKTAQPPEPPETQPRDPRTVRTIARSRALLTIEIQQLETLFAKTAQNAPDRPQLARRLAEDYVELETAATHEKTLAEMHRDTLKTTKPQEAAQWQATANQAAAIVRGARMHCIQYYSLIAKEHPGYPLMDEVLYYLAYEHEQAGDLTSARRVYYDLIKTVPSSKYIPNAYLAFAELFFTEAQGDPSKWDLAAQAYAEVIKFPPPANKMYGYAFYKLAYVFWNKGELDKALSAFKKVIEHGAAFSQISGAEKLADSARRDIIPVYALKGDPGTAYSFLHGIAGDPAGTNTKTFRMLGDLGMAYLDTGHYPEAITVFKDLLIRDRTSDEACMYQSHVSEAVLAMASGNKDTMRAELDNQLKAYGAFNNGSHSAETKTACANKTAQLVTETAMAWHVEAVGSQNQRGTGDPKTMSLASYFYKRIADTWSAAEYKTFEFPRIVKQDWPTMYKIKYAAADLLYFQKKWGECGAAFDAAFAEDPTGPDAAEAAYTSGLCYQHLYEAAHTNGTDRAGLGAHRDDRAFLQPRALSAVEQSMVRSFDHYVCFIRPQSNDASGIAQLIEVKYARARTYFESHNWEEAALAFRDIAFNHADSDDGIHAAQLYLESLNVLRDKVSPAHAWCLADMATDVPKLEALYCTSDKLRKNDTECGILARVEVDLLRLQAEASVKKGDDLTQLGRSTEATAFYESGASQYLELFRKYCKAPIDQGKPPQAEHCDEIVYNAGRAYQAARLVAKAIGVRMMLLDPANKMDASPLAKKAVYEIGGNYQAIAVYDKAADFYEKYAQTRGDKADQALSDAVLLRLGLGDEQKAMEDATLFGRLFGQSKPVQAAAIALAVGAHWLEKGDPQKARVVLEGSKALFARAALDVQVQAFAALGKAYDKTSAPLAASAEYSHVRDLWKDPASAVKKIHEAYASEDDASKDKRVGRALNAVGEATFFAAEQLRRTTVDPLRFPEYHGSGEKKDVMNHVSTKVKAWMDAKEAAIAKVELEYKKIIDLQPYGPPKWIIAAGSRVGLLWGSYVDDFRRAPYPKAWDKEGCALFCGTKDELSYREIRQRYIDELLRASEPTKLGKAKPALSACLTYSAKFQYFDESSRACEVWLGKNYPNEYHVIDELRSAPTLSNGGLDDRPAPVSQR